MRTMSASYNGLYVPPDIPARTGRKSSAKGAARAARRALRPPLRDRFAKGEELDILTWAFMKVLEQLDELLPRPRGTACRHAP